MATNYGGMPTSVQNTLAKQAAAKKALAAQEAAQNAANKKTVAAVKASTPISNSTTLNTPVAVQDAQVAAQKTASNNTSTSLNTPIDVQNSQIAAQKAETVKSIASASTSLNTPVAVQDAQVAAQKTANNNTSTSLNTPVSVQNAMNPPNTFVTPTVENLNAHHSQPLPATPISYPDLASTPYGQQIARNTYDNVVSANTQRPTDILGSTPYGQQIGQTTYDNIISANTPATTSGFSGGSSSGSSGNTGGTSFSPTTDTTSSASTDINTGTSDSTGTASTSSEPETNTYLEQLKNMSFSYNLATDQGYQQAAAAAENAIIQSIIGRGGLYSSVAQSAVATKLTDLASEYEKNAYDQYTSERSYIFQLAQFEQDNINTRWDQNYKMSQAEADARQQDFENQLNLAQFQFSQEKEAFDQNQTIAAANRASQKSYTSSQAASAKATLATQEADVQTRLYNNQLETSELSSMKTQWSKTGTANKAVASYFSAYGVQVGDSISDYEDVITGLENSLTSEAYQISQDAIAIGQGKIASKYIDDYLTPTKSSTSTSNAGTTAANSTKEMQSAYNDLIASYSDSSTFSRKVQTLDSSSVLSALQSRLGQYYYNKFMAEIEKKKAALKASNSLF